MSLSTPLGSVPAGQSTCAFTRSVLSEGFSHVNRAPDTHIARACSRQTSGVLDRQRRGTLYSTPASITRSDIPRPLLTAEVSGQTPRVETPSCRRTSFDDWIRGKSLVQLYQISRTNRFSRRICTSHPPNTLHEGLLCRSGTLFRPRAAVSVALPGRRSGGRLAGAGWR